MYSPIGLETNKLWLGEGSWGVYVEVNVEGVEKTIILFLKVGEEWSGNLVWGSFFLTPSFTMNFSVLSMCLQTLHDIFYTHTNTLHDFFFCVSGVETDILNQTTKDL